MSHSKNGIFSDCFVAIMQVLMLIMVGFLLFKRKFMNGQQIKDLSRYSEYIFCPCLIFANFIKVDLFTLKEWLPVVLLVLLSVILGYALGSLAEIYLLYDVEVGYMTPIICAIAHTNSIQLFLCESLSPLLDELTAQSPLQTEDNASSRGTSVVMTGLLVVTIIRWTLGRKGLSSPTKTRTMEAGSPNEVQLVPLINNKINTNHADFSETITTTQPHLNLMGLSKTENIEQETKLRKVINRINDVMNAPLWAAFAALMVGLIPPLQSLFTTQGAIMNVTITQTCKVLGRVMMPVMLLTLGGNLGSSYEKSDQSKSITMKTFVIMTTIKLIVMPAIAIPFIFMLVNYGLLQDPVMVFICCFNFAAPPANNLILIATKYGNCAGEVAQILFYGYAASIITLPIISSIVLNQISSSMTA